MARGVNQAKLMEKIAAQLKLDVNEVTKAVKESTPLQSETEMILERQSVINFYRARIERRAPERRQGESALAFKKRFTEWEKAYNEWRFKECKSCLQEFAYAYHYEGVAYCSLECLDDELRKIGMQVTRNRDPKKRWGLYHPAIVSASALSVLRTLPSPSESEPVDPV